MPFETRVSRQPSTTQPLTITYRSPADLRPHRNNARTHSRAQIKKIQASIREFGFANPVLIRGDGTIIAGHGRVAAAKLLGMEQVPTITIEHLSEDQIRAYVIADNRLAELAGWDDELLKIELGHLSTLDLSFDVTLTGFEVAEIDMILGDEVSEDDEEPVPEPAGVAVTQPGDLWLLGRHRLLCGSALDDSSYRTLMEAGRALLVFVDPPYNVRIDGHASGNGAVRHREFAMASGEMSEAEFTAFLRQSFELLAAHSEPGSVHYLCMDWRHMRELLDAASPVYEKQLALCVWAKDNGGMGSLYRSQHELVFVYKTAGAGHRNNIQLGKYGRYRTNLWQYPCANTLSRQGGEGDLLRMHPTVKPTALVADAILDCSERGGIVLDAFLGSGTTLLAAERTGRVCRGLELDPLYVDVAVRRWQALTGDAAVHAVAGQTFDEVAAVAESAAFAVSAREAATRA